MIDEDRIKAAEQAATDWTPNIMNQDRFVVTFARRCYAEGYAAGLRRSADLIAMGRSHQLLTPRPDAEWKVAPC